MRAAICSGPRVIRLRECGEPAPPPGEALIRVRNCGVCGSDLHWFGGELGGLQVCPGHEVVGEIAALGAGVKGWGEGQRVAVEPLEVCRECPACRAGNYQQCTRMRILGISRPGGFADYVTVPDYSLYELPPELDFEAASLAEPTAVCVHAVRLGGVGIGDRVLVLGAGTIGLLSVWVARAAGAIDVTITARHAHQAEMARRLGATRVFATTAEGERQRAAHLSDRPADVVIETVGGRADTLADATRAVRAGGTVVVLGFFTGNPALPAGALLAKEVRLIGSLMYGRCEAQGDFDIALQLLAAHRDEIAGLVTHRFDLADVQAAFEAASDKTTGAIKVTVTA